MKRFLFWQSLAMLGALVMLKFSLDDLYGTANTWNVSRTVWWSFLIGMLSDQIWENLSAMSVQANVSRYVVADPGDGRMVRVHVSKSRKVTEEVYDADGKLISSKVLEDVKTP